MSRRCTILGPSDFFPLIQPKLKMFHMDEFFILVCRQDCAAWKLMYNDMIAPEESSVISLCLNSSAENDGVTW